MHSTAFLGPASRVFDVLVRIIALMALAACSPYNPGRPSVPGIPDRTRQVQPRDDYHAAGSCDQIGKWIADAESARTDAPAARSQSAEPEFTMALTSEPRFSNYFGKAYEQMSEADLKPYLSLLNTCFARGGPLANVSSLDKTAARNAVTYSRQRTNIASLRGREKNLASVDEARLQVESLGPDEQGYIQLLQIIERSEPVVARVSADDRIAYKAAIMRAEERVAIPVESQRVNQLVNSSDPTMLGKLYEMHERLAKRSVSATVNQAREANRQLLDRAIDKITTTAMIAETRTIETFGTGLPALERGVAWGQDFQRRYGTYAKRNQRINATMELFLQKRQQTLAQSRSSFQKELLASADPDRVANRYLLALDRAIPFGREYWEMVDQRKADQRKWIVLKSNPDLDRRAKKSFAEEPTEGEMYDALSSAMLNVSKNTKQLSQCEVSGKSNAVDGLACLMMKGSAAAGAGEPMILTQFEKVGCAQASGRYGFTCAYVVAFSGGVIDSPMFSGFAGTLMKQAGRSEGIFRHARDGWTWEKIEQVEVIRR